MCICTIFFVCVSYILCSGMWNIDLKKKKNPTYLPYFFSMLRQSNNFFFFTPKVKAIHVLHEQKPNLNMEHWSGLRADMYKSCSYIIGAYTLKIKA